MNSKTIHCRASADEDAIAGTHLVEREMRAARPKSNAGRRQIDPVTVAATDHLGIAGRHRDAAVARGIGQRVNDAAQQRNFQPFLQKDVQGHKAWQGAADRQVVDGTVHRQRTDIAAWEFEGLDREAIGRYQQISIGRHRQDYRIGVRIKVRIGQCRHEQFLDQLTHQPPAVAVCQADVRVAQLHDVLLSRALDSTS